MWNEGTKSLTISALGRSLTVSVGSNQSLQTVRCGGCGAGITPGVDNYCTTCGTQAPPLGPSCKGCMRMLDPSERFCSVCGSQNGEVGPRCTKCHFVSDPGSAFCIRCGESLLAHLAPPAPAPPAPTLPASAEAPPSTQSRGMGLPASQTRAAAPQPRAAAPNTSTAAGGTPSFQAPSSVPATVNPYGQPTMMSQPMPQPQPMMSHQMHPGVGAFMQPAPMYQSMGMQQMHVQQPGMSVQHQGFVHQSVPQPPRQAAPRPQPVHQTVAPRYEPQRPPPPPNVNPNFNPNFGLGGPGSVASAPPAPPEVAAALGMGAEAPPTVMAEPR